MARLAGALPAGASDSQDWKKAESRSFVVYTDASERELRSTVTQLEAFGTALAALFPKLSLSSQSRPAGRTDVRPQQYCVKSLTRVG